MFHRKLYVILDPMDKDWSDGITIHLDVSTIIRHANCLVNALTQAWPTFFDSRVTFKIFKLSAGHTQTEHQCLKEKRNEGNTEQGNKDNLAIINTFFIEGCGDEFFTKYFKTGRKNSETFTLVLLYIH